MFLNYKPEDSTANKYAVTKTATGVWFPKKLPEHMSVREALFFAAYIVAALDKGGYEFQEILRQVRRV